MSTDLSIEQASLTQLQQTPVDNVIAILDKGLVHLPSYQELYYRWEKQQWSTSDIDLSADRQQWQTMSEFEQLLYTYTLAPFFQGEDSVADALSFYIPCFPEVEMRLYAMTQQVDEARHTIFFARFFNEVVGMDRGMLKSTLAEARQYMNADQKYMLIEVLDTIGEKLRRNPENLDVLVEAVVIYHVLIEGTVGLAGMRTILDGFRQRGVFPGFRGGFTAVARDESRHVVFGVKFLREMIQHDQRYASVIQTSIEKYAPSALRAASPTNALFAKLQVQGINTLNSTQFARESLRKKLKVIGLNMQLPLYN